MHTFHQSIALTYHHHHQHHHRYLTHGDRLVVLWAMKKKHKTSPKNDKPLHPRRGALRRLAIQPYTCSSGSIVVAVAVCIEGVDTVKLVVKVMVIIGDVCSVNFRNAMIWVVTALCDM